MNLNKYLIKRYSCENKISFIGMKTIIYNISNVVPPSRKECSYMIRVSQSSSSLTKFIANSINIYVSNKFIMKIYSMTNLMILILHREC
jgi:hypothetical protein